MASDLRSAVAAMSESRQKRGPVEFDDLFTVFPDSGSTELHCVRCDEALPVGYHPSLDVLVEQARAHNLEKH